MMKDVGTLPSKRFVGKTVLVTGAGQGIGEATAYRFAAEGGAVGVLDRNPETAARVSASIIELGGRSIPLTADVTNEAAVTGAVSILVEQFGPVDVLVNNAGFDRAGGFLKTRPDDFLAVWSVHLLAATHCVRAVIEAMIQRGDGRIVNVSSIYGRVGSKGESAYCAAKAGIIGLTKALAREFGAKGVRVNAALPGLTNTPTIREIMAPKFKEQMVRETILGRLAEPTEIAAAIAFLASDDASFITGACLEITGGWNL